MIDDIRIWWREGHPLVSRWTHDPQTYELTWVAHAANAYHRWTRWVRYSWWRYILEPRRPYRWTWTDTRYAYRSWPGTVWCRLIGHRGRIFYNPGEAMEPNDGCKNCGEEIA